MIAEGRGYGPRELEAGVSDMERQLVGLEWPRHVRRQLNALIRDINRYRATRHKMPSVAARDAAWRVACAKEQELNEMMWRYRALQLDMESREADYMASLGIIDGDNPPRGSLKVPAKFIDSLGQKGYAR